MIKQTQRRIIHEIVLPMIISQRKGCRFNRYPLLNTINMRRGNDSLGREKEKSMKKTCGVLATVILILGFIGSIVLAGVFGVRIEEVTEGTYYKYTTLVEHRDYGLTFGIFFGAFISVLIVSIILYALSEILERLEKLEGINLKTPNEAVNEATDNTIKVSEKEPTPSTPDGFWKCAHCGTINLNRVKKCWCSQRKWETKD